MTYLVMVLCIALGYCMGLIHKGIHIHVDKSEPQKPKEYNTSMVKHLPKEVQQYYQQTNGFNQF